LNVVLLVLDTVRADHLGCYGYSRRTSPHVDAFAREAVRYARAYSPSPWTLPSHASMFTGRYPFEHGAHRYLRKRPGPWGHIFSKPLAEGWPTLAEAFEAEGYATGAFTANSGYMARRYGLCQGFGTYEVERQPGIKLADQALKWVGDQTARPFFLFMNFMDAHVPYNTALRPGVLEASPSRDKQLPRKLAAAVLPGAGRPVPQDLVRKVTDQYDMGIANADLAVGRVLAGLQRRGTYENTVVVITSDHGEYLGEHALAGHGKEVYEEALWVPLLIKSPAGRPKRPTADSRIGAVVEARVSTVQIPRFVSAAFPSAWKAEYSGLLRHRPSDHPVVAENHFTLERDYTHRQWGHRFKTVRTAYYDRQYKYIHSSDGRHELYDLTKDPAESRNLVRREAAVARRLDKSLRAWRSACEPTAEATPEGPPIPLSDAEKAAMQALGYLD